MVLSRILAAAGISLLAIAGAAACDDYDEEMAVQAARNAAKVALSRTSEGQSAAAPSTPVQSTEVAAAEPQPAQAGR